MDLNEIVHNNLWKFIDKIKPIGHEWKVIIVSDELSKLFEIKGIEIIDHKIAHFSKMSGDRCATKTLDIVYIIKPKISDIESVMNDYNNGKQIYTKIHFVFVGQINGKCLNYMRKYKKLKNKHLLYQFSHTIKLIESRVFLIKSEETNYARIIRHLYNYFESTYSLPIIQYDSSLREFAEHLDEKLEWLEVRNNYDTKLLLLNRNFDITEIFKHRMTYQCFLYENMNLEDFTLVREFNNDKNTKLSDDKNTKISNDKETKLSDEKEISKVRFDESDMIFNQFRHTDLCEVAETLGNKFEEFKDQFSHIINMMEKNDNSIKRTQSYQSNLSKIGDADKIEITHGRSLSVVHDNRNTLETIRSLHSIVHSLPSFRKGKESYGANIEMVSKCINEYEKLNMNNILDIEHGIIYGKSRSGKPMKRKKIFKLLKNYKRKNAHYFRLLVLCYLYFGIIPCESNKYNYDKLLPFKNDDYELQRKNNKYKKIVNEKCKLENICNDLVMNNLPEASFSTCYKDPSITKNIKINNYIIFVMGGITYNEIKTIYDASKKYNINIIIGSNEIIMPNEKVYEFIHK